MEYHCLANLLPKPIAEYQWGLISAIAARFPQVLKTKDQAIPAHFTLKYRFGSDNIAELEQCLQEFAGSHQKAPIQVGGFDKFGHDTVFIKIELSEKARNVCKELIGQLRKISWMQWREHDGENLHFHSTLAEKCDGLDEQILSFIRGKEQYFDSNFDNITLLQEVGTTTEGFRMWKPIRTFSLSD